MVYSFSKRRLSCSKPRTIQPLPAFKWSFSCCLCGGCCSADCGDCSCGYCSHRCSGGRQRFGLTGGRTNVRSLLLFFLVIQIWPRHEVTETFVAFSCKGFNFLTWEDAIPQIDLSHEVFWPAGSWDCYTKPTFLSYSQEIVRISICNSLSIKVHRPDSCLAWQRDTHLMPLLILQYIYV